MRRFLSRSRGAVVFASLVATLSLVGILVIAPANSAAACECGGGLIPPADSTISLVSERAIVSLTDGIQQTDLLLRLTGNASNAGLIIPTPTPATVSAGTLESFDAVERAMLPRPVYVDDWWGVAAITAAITTEPSSIPVVLDRVQLGPIEAVTLAATDAAALSVWLQDNGYTAPEGAAAVLAPYVEAGWSFVVTKLSAPELLNGTIDPIRLTFATDSLVFPTRLLQGYATEQSLRLYVVSDHRVQLARAGTEATRLNAAERLIWAGKVSALATHTGSFMTVFDIRYDNPEIQATTDIGVIQASSDEETVRTVTVVKTITLLGVPFGSVLVGAGVLALVLLLGTFAVRMRVR
jgi:hypothetical protein